MRWWFRQQLYVQIFICVIIGIILGIILGPDTRIVKPFGDIFIRLLKMLIVPLTFFTLISGITQMEDLRSLRSIGGMTLVFYLFTSLFAATVGILTALILKPGKDIVGVMETGNEIPNSDFNFIENLINWFPTNPIEAMASANMLQIIMFSLFIGVALLALGERTRHLSILVQEGSHLMIKITNFVMMLAPYGIMFLVADMVGTLGQKMLTEVGRFIITDYIALLFVLIVFYPLLLILLGRCRPIRFYRNVAPAMLVAASTTSSAATLPISFAVAKKNLGIPERIYGFILPLGATINMDGMAVAIGVISVFAANLYGLPITTGFIFQFMFLGLALSIGTAGVKGGGIIMATVLFQTLNMPLTLIPILAAIWPIIDIGHTTTNITGDLNITTIVASRLKKIDKEIFNEK